MKRISTIAFTLVVLLIAGCQKEVLKTDKHFYIKIGKSVLPVWITGNTTSNTFIVVIHGGPGAFSSLFDRSPAFEKLGQQYGLVYFDQSGTVNDQGTAGIEDVSENVFAEQTDAVVEYIRQNYTGASVFLMGHSNGGAVGTNYLLDAARQAKVKGWIEVDGAHIKLQSPIAFNLTKNYVLNYANSKLLEEGLSKKERKMWEECVDFENSMTAITKQNQRAHTDWVGKARGYYYDPKNNLQFNDVVDLLLFSKTDMAAVTANQIQAINAPNQLNPPYDDYTPVMYRITVPSLIVSGRYDGILPVELVTYAINALGTPVADKHSFIFENSAHNPFDEEPELFYEKVKEFIDRYQ